MSIWPLEDTPLPKGYNGFLLFFDEFNSASLAVQAASYKIVLDREIGQHPLHKKAVIVCAGNMTGDNAIVNRLSTAMQSRLIHLELMVDPLMWIEWASKNHLDHRVISYIHSRPDNLHKFDPDHNDKTFACPRTWHFTSKLIKNDNSDLMDKLPLLAGTISEGVAREFVVFHKACMNLPTLDEVLKDPAEAKLDSDPAMLYAVSHMLATYTTPANIDKIMIYILRLPIEFGTITLQNVLRRNKDMIKEKAVRDWVTQKGAELF